MSAREFDDLMSAVDAIRADIQTPARPSIHGPQGLDGPVEPPEEEAGKGPTPGPAVAAPTATRGSTGSVVEPGAGASSGRGGESSQRCVPPRPVMPQPPALTFGSGVADYGRLS